MRHMRRRSRIGYKQKAGSGGYVRSIAWLKSTTRALSVRIKGIRPPREAEDWDLVYMFVAISFAFVFVAFVLFDTFLSN